MRKIPTVFVRDPADMAHLTDEWHPDCLWVRDGEGTATRKYDGTCVLLRRDGIAIHPFVRREVKPGNEAPKGWREVEHDPATGKRVGWLPYAGTSFERFIDEALTEGTGPWPPGTYELCGPRINKNPEGYDQHVLVSHADAEQVASSGWPPPPTTDLVAYVAGLVISMAVAGWEGIVWHHPDGRMAKLKARDYR